MTLAPKKKLKKNLNFKGLKNLDISSSETSSQAGSKIQELNHDEIKQEVVLNLSKFKIYKYVKFNLNI